MKAAQECHALTTTRARVLEPNSTKTEALSSELIISNISRSRHSNDDDDDIIINLQHSNDSGATQRGARFTTDESYR